MARDVKAYLSRKKNEASDLDVAQLWAELEELHTNRLWHQLTLKLLIFVNHSTFQHGGLLEFYHNFLADFELKINPLSLVEIVLTVIKEITDPAEVISFLNKTKEKVKNLKEAQVLCMTAIGQIHLQNKELDDIKTIIEEGGEILDEIGGVSSVHSQYYELCSQYHMLRADHASYYRDALHYLGCTDIETIPLDEQVQRAFSLGLAALLGKDVYNFGELLAHPILVSLQGTDKQWLVKVLYAFNAGDLVAFKNMRPLWEQQPDLQASQEGLFNKIRLLALMELVFKKHAHDRTISFSAISEVTDVPLNEVELLVMKALSLQLVKGTIDEVSQEINMTWVQPRVLDLPQVNVLKSRMEEWCRHTKGTTNLVKDEAPDVAVTH